MADCRLILTSGKTQPPTKPKDLRTWGQLRGDSGALAVAEIISQRRSITLVLTTSVDEAEALAPQIDFFAQGQSSVQLFPDVEVLPYDSFSPHQELVSERLRLLQSLDSKTERMTIVAAWPSLLSRLPPAAYLRERGFRLQTNQKIDSSQFRNNLDDAGYVHVPQVTLQGEYAVRGSLIDFFPTGHHCPIRVDFFDDSIESLREFDPDTQISSNQIRELTTLPARELPCDEPAVSYFRQAFRARFAGDPTRSLIYREVSEGRLPPGVEAYLPLFFATTATFWDYLPDGALVIAMGTPSQCLDSAWQQIAERHEQAQHDQARPVLRPDELFLTQAEHQRALDRYPQLILDRHKLPAELLGNRQLNLPIAPAPSLLINRRDEDPTAALRAFIVKHSGMVLLAAESPGRREFMLELLRDADIFPNICDGWADCVAQATGTAITIAPLEQGFVLADHSFALLTDVELFGERTKTRRRQRRVQDPESLINDLTDLRAGAPVVHVDHGVGRYIGLTNLNIDHALTEFVSIEYAGGDRLHVPVTSLQLISRYTGSAPEHAPLHRLGTDQWARAKRRAAAKIRDVAAELLDLYAQRASRPGRAANFDPHDYLAFAASFPFTPTDDQDQAIAEVLGDLSASQPMDRLVCGDVGFGKTEVALRAAFVAVADGRQVAILVPTTLLAQQHYQNFADRFADWPVRVEQLSRFRNAKESREVVAGLADGTVDIVIGTHRLLQTGVEFKDLGLAIIDEEHRFGVRHKEKLKALRTSVDILTLTATPIPRTLNLALGGLREMSLIATPPESRLAIKTFVLRWQDHIIREACQRELKRGGQVYFVHNRIEDIERIAAQVSELLPDAKIEVAHGQMRERELERIMLDFYHRRFHVLVCTAIIESGLDVPTANTILINHAHRFGLAQLHQLRGRVGRSHHQAFAYLLTPAREALTADAVKRLDAIESLEDLGAGFVLATHDLEIRGAGELLGEEQSGQIQEIGFTLYNDILTRTIESLRDGEEPDPETPTEMTTDINLHLPALIPDDYMPDVHLRLVHYKKIASAADTATLSELQVELIDRFGLIPAATQNLFRIARLRLQTQALGLKRIDIGPTGGRVEFGAKTTVEPRILVGLLESQGDRYSFDAQQRLRIQADLEADEARFACIEELLACLNEPPIPRDTA